MEKSILNDTVLSLWHMSAMLDSFKVALFELKFQDSRSGSVGKNTVITLHSQCSVESAMVFSFISLYAFLLFLLFAVQYQRVQSFTVALAV